MASPDNQHMDSESFAQQPDIAVLRAALQTGVAMGQPGLSVAIGRGSEVVWTGAEGYSDLLKRTPLSTDDRFGVGSITKTFVAVLVFQLASEGRLQLDEPCTTYVDTPIVHRVPNAKRASLRQLLSHTSGVPTWEFQPTWIKRGRGAQLEPDRVWDQEETLNYVTDDLAIADFEPGAGYAYSNTNYTLLGLVIEAVTGNPLSEELRRRILEPLNMNTSCLDSFEPSRGRLTHNYHYATPDFRRDAGLHPSFVEVRAGVVETSAANLSPEWAAGGLTATAADLVHFALALRNGRLLAPEAQREMFSVPPSDASQSSYLYGVVRWTDAYGAMTVLGHGGGTLGYSAAMFWFEKIDLAVVALSNIGTMHSGLRASPAGVFFQSVLLPAVIEALGLEAEAHGSS